MPFSYNVSNSLNSPVVSAFEPESIPESSEGIWWNPAETPEASDMRGESRFLLCDSSCSIECTSDSDKGLSKGVARRVPNEVFSRSLQEFIKMQGNIQVDTNALAVSFQFTLVVL